ncbi:unnamed protein product, partial [marine sediment metagenome]
IGLRYCFCMNVSSAILAGSDRTGEACALHLLAHNYDLKQALFQLSSTFGHKKWLFPCKHYLINNMDKLYPGLIDNMQHICGQRYSYEDLKNIPANELYMKILSNTIGNDDMPEETESTAHKAMNAIRPLTLKAQQRNQIILKYIEEIYGT